MVLKPDSTVSLLINLGKNINKLIENLGDINIIKPARELIKIFTTLLLDFFIRRYKGS